MAPQQTSAVSERDSGMERTKCSRCADGRRLLRERVEEALERARKLKAYILHTDKAGPEGMFRLLYFYVSLPVIFCVFTVTEGPRCHVLRKETPEQRLPGNCGEEIERGRRRRSSSTASDG